MNFKMFYEMPTMSNDDAERLTPKDIQRRFEVVSAKKPVDMEEDDRFFYPTYQSQMGQYITFAVDKETNEPAARVSFKQDDAGIPIIQYAGVVDAYRGIGLGQKIYEQLLNRYGKLGSDTSLSPHSFKLWKRLGEKYPGKTYISNLTNSWGDVQNTKLVPVDGFSLGDLGNKSHFVICLRNC